MHINHELLRTQDDFNDFTAALKNQNCITMVKLRNGTYVKVEWREGDPDEYEESGFESTDGFWWNNGRSLKSDSFDIVEF